MVLHLTAFCLHSQLLKDQGWLLHKRNGQKITFWKIAIKYPKTTKTDKQWHILAKWDELRPFEGLKAHFRAKLKISYFGAVLKNWRKNWTFKFPTLQTPTKFQMLTFFNVKQNFRPSATTFIIGSSLWKHFLAEKFELRKRHS